jgi:PBP1b-binding outer membrane lipoprotein LpoB
MKKVLSLLAMTLMIVGLSGCMDDPDGSKQKVSSSTTSSIQL